MDVAPKAISGSTFDAKQRYMNLTDGTANVPLPGQSRMRREVIADSCCREGSGGLKSKQSAFVVVVKTPASAQTVTLVLAMYYLQHIASPHIELCLPVKLILGCRR